MYSMDYEICSFLHGYISVYIDVSLSLKGYLRIALSYLCLSVK